MSHHLSVSRWLILLSFLAFSLTAADKLVDVNTATQQEIATLPGVGGALAKKIVENRPYASLDDLKRSGIPADLLQQIASKITVSRSQNEPPGGQAGLISEAKPSSPEAHAAHLRVAILNFDYEAVRSQSSEVLGKNTDVGKAVADALGQRLSKDASYTVIDRASADCVLTEQDLSNGNRYDPAAMERVGKLLDADVVIIGSVTRFGREKGTHAAFGGTSSGKNQWKSAAVVGLKARVVDVKTGQIVAVAEESGEWRAGGTSEIFHKATSQAVQKLTNKLTEGAPFIMPSGEKYH